MAEKKPKYSLKQLQQTAAEVGLILGHTRARDIIAVHISTSAEGLRFAEQLVAALEESDFIGTKVLEPPFPGEYDEYCLSLPGSLIEQFNLDAGDWYVGLKFNGENVSVFCISMHPSTKSGAKK